MRATIDDELDQIKELEARLEETEDDDEIEDLEGQIAELDDDANELADILADEIEAMAAELQEIAIH